MLAKPRPRERRANLSQGNDIGLSKELWGIELIETATTVGGVTLNSGSIVLTTDRTDTIGAVTVEPQDLFYLTVTQTTMVGGTSVATATMLLDGSDVYLDAAGEDIDALTLQSPPNAAPVLDNLGAMQLTTIGQNSLNTSGDLVSAIILSAGGDRITDANTGAVEGLAITAVDNTNGSWQYSIDGGASWAGFGAVSRFVRRCPGRFGQRSNSICPRC